MSKHYVAALAISALGLAARDASAQQPPDPPRPPAAIAVVAPAARVRIHVRAAGDRSRVVVESPDADGRYKPICTTQRLEAIAGGVRRPYSPWAPCVADVAVGTELRVTLDGEPQTLVVPAEPGGELDIEVVPESRSSAAPGVVLTVIGGAAMGVGLMLALLAHELSPSNDTTTPLLIVAGFGAAGVLGGIALLVTRPVEPARVVVEPSSGASQGNNRNHTLLGDLAPHGSRDVFLSRPFTPLGYAFTF